MDNSQGPLKKFLVSRSNFFSLEDGETKKVKYIGAEQVPNKFDGGKTTAIRYQFEFEGKEQLWDRGSRRLAEEMAKIPEGSFISIKRVGKGTETNYFIEQLQ